jgi:hypothetical protein
MIDHRLLGCQKAPGAILPQDWTTTATFSAAFSDQLKTACRVYWKDDQSSS